MLSEKQILGAIGGFLGGVIVAWAGGLILAALAGPAGSSGPATQALSAFYALFPTPADAGLELFLSVFKTLVWGVLGALGGAGVTLKF